ncbi:MAG TPA: hypothetical protein PLB10_15140 [Thiolinea sp.]|nr:hypothetical protein [Thiolinea sp.]
MPQTLSNPPEHLVSLWQRKQPARLLIGLAGQPGSGKSTIARHWREAMRIAHPELPMQVLGMDGFHLSRSQLAALPDPDAAFARRGAPWTFDAAGFVAKVAALRADAGMVKWPDFDHSVGDPEPDALQVGPAVRVVLVEGLYLLYREGDWAGLNGLFDECWFLDTDPTLALERLLVRHQQAWGFSREQALARYRSNDGLNAGLVRHTRQRADWLV